METQEIFVIPLQSIVRNYSCQHLLLLPTIRKYSWATRWETQGFVVW